MYEFQLLPILNSIWGCQSFSFLAISMDVKSWFWFVSAEHKLDENPLERQGHQLMSQSGYGKKPK